MFVSDLWQVSLVNGFSQGTPISSTNKINHHELTEIFLKLSRRLELRF
jgi:hypothetical protein